MKVKLKYNYNLQDEEMKPIVFKKNKEYNVIYVFKNREYGVNDHTAFVIINELGESLSVSIEVCEIVE